MHKLDGKAFRERLARYLEGFSADIKTAPSREHFCNYVRGLIGGSEREKNIPVTIQWFEIPKEIGRRLARFSLNVHSKPAST